MMRKGESTKKSNRLLNRTRFLNPVYGLGGLTPHDVHKAVAVFVLSFFRD